MKIFGLYYYWFVTYLFFVFNLVLVIRSFLLERERKSVFQQYKDEEIIALIPDVKDLKRLSLACLITGCILLLFMWSLKHAELDEFLYLMWFGGVLGWSLFLLVCTVPLSIKYNKLQKLADPDFLVQFRTKRMQGNWVKKGEK